MALQDLLDNIIDYSTTCPAPTFPCDLSVLTKKATKRLSGARALWPKREHLPDSLRHLHRL